MGNSYNIITNYQQSINSAHAQSVQLQRCSIHVISCYAHNHEVLGIDYILCVFGNLSDLKYG